MQGYLFGLLSAMLSALAAVYTEWVMKRNNDSLYWQVTHSQDERRSHAVTCSLHALSRSCTVLLRVCTPCACYILQLVNAQNIQLYGFGVIFNGLGLAGTCSAVASALDRTYSKSA